MTDNNGTTDVDLGNVIRFEVDLDALARYASSQYNYDTKTEYPTGPDSLPLLVVERAAAQLVADLDREQRRRLQDRVAAAVGKRIDELADKVVSDVLETSVVVGQSGRPDNKRYLVLAEPDDADDAMPLHEVVEQRVMEWLNGSIPDPNGKDRYNTPQVTRLALYAREASTRKVTDELREALDEGKAQVKAALRDQGAQILQETIERQATAR